MKFYYSYMKLHLKRTLQYKASFIIAFISQIFVFFTYYFTIIALFNKFNNVLGYTVYDVLLTFSIIQFGISFVESFARGLDHFDKLIIQGEYDRILLRPKSTLLQIVCYEMDFTKVCKFIQSLIVLTFAIIKIDVTWNISKIITLVLMLLSSVIIFFGIFLISGAYCFITMEGLETRNVLNDGCKHMAQYPIGIFARGFRFFFTFIIPFSFVNYYPLLYLLGRTDNKLYMFSPILVSIFLVLSFISFNKLSKRYTSAGS